MDIKSLFSLTKFNNGFFRSEKQAKFLLSQCQEGATYYSDSQAIYNNMYRFAFHMDVKGIVSVEKITRKSTTIVWERMDDQAFADSMVKLDAKKAQKERANKVATIAANWTARADEYKENNIVALMQSDNRDMVVIQRNAKVYQSITAKIELLASLHRELIGVM